MKEEFAITEIEETLAMLAEAIDDVAFDPNSVRAAFDLGMAYERSQRLKQRMEMERVPLVPVSELGKSLSFLMGLDKDDFFKWVKKRSLGFASCKLTSMN